MHELACHDDSLVNMKTNATHVQAHARAYPQAYTFATLSNVVEYLQGQIKKYLGLDPTDPRAHPYQLL